MGTGSPWGITSSFEAACNTDIHGVEEGISTFLPLVQANTEAGNPSSIVITGSKGSTTHPPGRAAYDASKATVKSIAEHLSSELDDYKNLAVYLLVPGEGRGEGLQLVEPKADSRSFGEVGRGGPTLGAMS